MEKEKKDMTLEKLPGLKENFKTLAFFFFFKLSLSQEV